MDLRLDNKLLSFYKSNSQNARLFTETWVEKNVYCLSCGAERLNKFTNNKPVADFYCNSCFEEYELKSSRKLLPNKIVDGAYSTMIQRISSNNNPSFFFMNYSVNEMQIRNFVVIPKHFFVGEIIEKRKPLSMSAGRAGWTGCNILLNEIPALGKLYLIRDGVIQKKEIVLKNWSETSFLAKQETSKRGWTIETMKIVDKLEKQFSLTEVYAFESLLKSKFPNNNFIKDKLRQQLQVLRDKNLIEFLGNGKYRKVNF